MKKILFFAGILVFIVSCSTGKVNFSQLQNRNGLFYLMNKDKPFTGDVISYQNGKVEFEGRIDKGLRSGGWVYYYPTGQKMAEGTYKEGLKDGNWTTWRENGQQLAVEPYKTGKYVKGDGTPSESGKTDSIINSAASSGNDVAGGTQGTEEKRGTNPPTSTTTNKNTTQPQAPAKAEQKQQAVVWESLTGGSVKFLNRVPYTGPVVKYFKGGGGIELEGYFTAGHRSGKWTYFDRRGNVKDVRFY